MLDLAYTALLDFLARFKKSSLKTDSVEPRFVPIQRGVEPNGAEGLEKNAPELGSEASRPDHSGESIH